MNEFKLTDKHLREIAELAHREFIENSPRRKKEQLFLCECYLKAIVSFCLSYNLVFKDGKMYYAQV